MPLPEQFIIVGGPSRSGTNTASTFLHLHDDVLMWHTFSVDKGRPITQSNDIVRDLEDSFPAGLQVVAGNEEIHAWKAIVKELNANADINSKYRGVRWDYAELRVRHFREAIRVPMRFVYCMRNLFDVFCSQAYAGYFRYPEKDSWKEAMRLFSLKIHESFDYALKIREMGIPIYAHEAGDDLSGLLGFIGIEANELQRKWLAELPVTNWTPGQRYLTLKQILKKQVEISEHLLERFRFVKQSLQTV